MDSMNMVLARRVRIEAIRFLYRSIRRAHYRRASLAARLPTRRDYSTDRARFVKQVEIIRLSC